MQIRSLTAVMLLCLPSLLVTGAPAQDDVLAVERREDLAGRNGLVRVLRATRADFAVEGLAPSVFCRLLSTRLGDKVTFHADRAPDGDAEPGVGITARGLSLWSAMAIAQEQTGRRFVYRSGVVFLVPPAAIRPLAYVVTYDLRSQVVRLRSFPGPELRLPGANDDAPRFPPEEDSETTVSGFTADGIEALLREHVTPAAWDSGPATISNSNGLFVVRHSIEGHAEVRRLLVMLGLIPPPPRGR